MRLSILLMAAVTPSISQAVQQAVDPCRSVRQDGNIVVCGRTPEQERQRYRLPREDRGFDPRGSIDSVSRERHRLIDGDGASADLSRGSCSAVGAAGWTGCQIKGWRERGQQKGQ